MAGNLSFARMAKSGDLSLASLRFAGAGGGKTAAAWSFFLHTADCIKIACFFFFTSFGDGEKLGAGQKAFCVGVKRVFYNVAHSTLLHNGSAVHNVHAFAGGGDKRQIVGYE